MKRIILLLSVFLVMGCSSDDNNTDSFVGKWVINRTYKESNIDGSITNVVSYEDKICYKEGKYDFEIREDKTFSLFKYEEINNECSLKETISGTWEKHSSSAYILHHSAGTTAFQFVSFKDNFMFMKIPPLNGQYLNIVTEYKRLR